MSHQMLAHTHQMLPTATFILANSHPQAPHTKPCSPPLVLHRTVHHHHHHGSLSPASLQRGISPSSTQRFRKGNATHVAHTMNAGKLRWQPHFGQPAAHTSVPLLALAQNRHAGKKLSAGGHAPSSTSKTDLTHMQLLRHPLLPPYLVNQQTTAGVIPFEKQA